MHVNPKNEISKFLNNRYRIRPDSRGRLSVATLERYRNDEDVLRLFAEHLNQATEKRWKELGAEHYLT